MKVISNLPTGPAMQPGSVNVLSGNIEQINAQLEAIEHQLVTATTDERLKQIALTLDRIEHQLQQARKRVARIEEVLAVLEHKEHACTPPS